MGGAQPKVVNELPEQAGTPNEAAVRQHLSKILGSRGFTSSERLCRFLQLSVDKSLNGENHLLKESVLGIEVFDRKPGYDPKVDPIVRVQAHRLRAKLADYYKNEGRDDAVRIDLPKGAYIPAFRLQDREAIVRHQDASAPQANRGLVVLPFVNLSRDEENEFFSDGLTEELINALTQVRDLRVVARTSAFAFKGKQQDIREIGRTLGVEAVLEGGVRRSGSKLRVTVQLVNAADGCQLWGQRYDRRIDDVFEIQENIAQSIVEALKIELSRLPSRPVKTYTRDTEAHHLYLKGRYWHHRWTVANSARAIGFFEEALQRDPAYAPAYSGLADCYFLLGLYGPDKPSKVMPRARAAALQALKIDETLAEAHCSLGLIAYSYDWDTPRCKEELERSLSLNPGYALARSKYGITYLTVTGRTREALEQVTQAVDLDPLSPQINGDLAFCHLMADRYSKAVDQVQKTLALDPSNLRAHAGLALAYQAQSRWQEGIDAAEQGLKVAPQSPWLVGILSWLHGCAGDRNSANEYRQQLNALSKTTYVSPMWFAFIHAGLDERDQFFEAMNAACDDRAPWLRHLKRVPHFRGLRSDSRFQQLIERLRLNGT
jgi:serine/threonine-protein kinase